MKEFENNALFWQKVDSLFLSGTKTLMKKKGEHHDTYNNLVYPVDYSRIVDMKSPSAHGVAVYMGSGNRNSVTGLIVAADILEKLGVNLMLDRPGRRSARRDGYGIFVRTEISFGNEKCRTGS